MKVGLISDTHDNVPMAKKAVELFNARAVDLVLHAGDFVSPFALKTFLSLECNFTGVWGNNDGDKLALQNVAQGRILNSPHIELYGEKRVLLGHHFETLESLVSSQDFFLIVCGHTHTPFVRLEGRTLVVNPGECGGWVSGTATVALADLEQQTAEIITL